MNELPPADDKVNILLVDDRPGNLLSLRGVLERPDYRLVTATSGEEALRLVLRQEFALILMDVAMPGMDGFEVASIIKQRNRSKTIPIIFVTASVQQIEWIFKGYSVGAVDFLQKPLDPHAVRSKVAVFVELHRQKQQLARHAAQLQEFERRQREMEVARVRLESERRYRHLAEAIPHVVWSADARGRVDYFNRRWFELSGLSEEESLGAAWRALIHPEDIPALREVWDAAVREGQPFHCLFRVKTRSGGYRWFRNQGLPEKDETGEVVSWVGTLTDVDDEKRAHEELEAAVRLRDEFMSVASHELRTPLSTLQLQLQSLQRQLERLKGESLDGQMARKLATAVRQTQRLAKLIDSLLDVSRIVHGRLDLHPEDFDLAGSVREVVDRFRDEAAQQGCELKVNARPVAGRWDRLRIEQVITNLLSNSLKYGAGKPIVLTVGPVDGSAQLVVEDQGIGIEPEKIQRIFDRFERAVPTRHYGGLGLGLYIARQIVDAHGGRIEVDSHPGTGSRFTITLPCRPPKLREPSPRALPPPEPAAANGSVV